MTPVELKAACVEAAKVAMMDGRLDDGYWVGVVDAVLRTIVEQGDAPSFYHEIPEMLYGKESDDGTE